MMQTTSPYRFYGRRTGKKMTPARRVILQDHQSAGGFPWWHPEESLTHWTHVCLEIGFGQGEHLIQVAQCHPATLFIGCEVFEEGVLRVLNAIRDLSLSNIRIFPHDARLLMDRLPDQYISRIFLLFPDPWPKKKHWKRRLVYPSNLPMLRRLLSHHGVLQLATDHTGYAQAMQETLMPQEGFHLLCHHTMTSASAAHDHEERLLRDRALYDFDTIQDPCVDPALTRYEQKALAKSQVCFYFTYKYFRDSGLIAEHQRINPSPQ